MRTIKFRAFDKKNKVMYYDVQEEYSGIIDGERIYSDTGRNNFGELLCDKNFVVNQFTGLKDKNGKDIYEGDIITDGSLNYTNIGTINYIVEYDNRFGCFGFRGKIGLQPFTWNGDIYEITKFKVIGNIYENKELIK